MADEGTAVLEAPDTAEVEEDTAVLETPETEIQDSPETEDAEDTPDSDDDSEPETLTREEHEKVLKAEKAKLEESYRRQTENAQREAEDKAAAVQYASRQQQAAQAMGGQVQNALLGIVNTAKRVIESGNDLDQGWVNQQLGQLTTALTGAAFLREHDAYVSEFTKNLGDYRVPKDQTAEMERAARSGSPQAMVKALSSMVYGKAYADAKADLEKEQAKATAEAAKTSKLREQTDKARGGPRTTTVGAGVGKGVDLDSMSDAAFMRLSSADQKKWLEKAMKR